MDLPLNGRGFHELARLTSGVALLPPTGNVQTVRPEQVNGNVIGGVGGAQTRFLLVLNLVSWPAADQSW